MDPRECVAILAARGAQELPCTAAPAGGQVIDLASRSVSRIAARSTAASGGRRRAASGARRRRARRGRAAGRAEAAPPPLDARGIARQFQGLQEQRVRACGEYDDGLDALLAAPPPSRLLAAYPRLCADATARFAALSRDIHAVEQRLRAVDAAALLPLARRAAELVRRVQALEKEKLELTAATHLEADARGAGRRRPRQRLRRQRRVCAAAHGRGRRRDQQARSTSRGASWSTGRTGTACQMAGSANSSPAVS